jgi:hypothetical protein
MLIREKLMNRLLRLQSMVHTDCKRKLVIAITDQHEAPKVNRAKGECKNIVGGCGCTHAEEQFHYDDRVQVVGVSYWPCLECATHMLKVFPNLEAVFYLHGAEHHPDGPEILRQNGVKCELFITATS